MALADTWPAMSIAQAHALLTAPGTPFEMAEAEVFGIPTRVWKNLPPTLRESFPAAGGALETIIAMVAPTGTPAAMVRRLDAAIQAALARPAVQQQFATLTTAPLPLSPEALAQRIATDNARWEALIQQAGIERE